MSKLPTFKPKIIRDLQSRWELCMWSWCFVSPPLEQSEFVHFDSNSRKGRGQNNFHKELFSPLQESLKSWFISMKIMFVIVQRNKSAFVSFEPIYLIVLWLLMLFARMHLIKNKLNVKIYPLIMLAVFCSTKQKK